MPTATLRILTRANGGSLFEKRERLWQRFTARKNAFDDPLLSFDQADSDR